jgi:hypothetical protein
VNLYEKINEVRKAIDYIQKDKSVSTGGGSYKAVSHDSVTGILRQHLIVQGIICVPNLVASKAHDRVGDAKQFRYDATYSFDFVNAEKPEEKITIVIEAHAMDNADKAPGKAISYAKKYAVLKLFEIETGEDEESRYQQPETISEEQVANIIALATEVNADMTKFRKFLAVDKLSDLPVSQLDRAIKSLEAKRGAKN